MSGKVAGQLSEQRGKGFAGELRLLIQNSHIFLERLEKLILGNRVSKKPSLCMVKNCLHFTARMLFSAKDEDLNVPTPQCCGTDLI